MKYILIAMFLLLVTWCVNKHDNVALSIKEINKKQCCWYTDEELFEYYKKESLFKCRAHYIEDTQWCRNVFIEKQLEFCKRVCK